MSTTLRVQTTVRHLQQGDVLSRGRIVHAVSSPERERHTSRQVCRVQFVGEAFARVWNAATTIAVERVA